VYLCDCRFSAVFFLKKVPSHRFFSKKKAQNMAADPSTSAALLASGAQHKTIAAGQLIAQLAADADAVTLALLPHIVCAHRAAELHTDLILDCFSLSAAQHTLCAISRTTSSSSRGCNCASRSGHPCICRYDCNTYSLGSRPGRPG
jgi:hypothetical protein